MASNERIMSRDNQGGTWTGDGLLMQQKIQQFLNTNPRPFDLAFYNSVPKNQLSSPALITKFKDWAGAANIVPELGEAGVVDFTTKKQNIEVFKVRSGFAVSQEMIEDTQYNMMTEGAEVVRDMILQRVEWELVRTLVYGAYGTTFKPTNLFIPAGSNAATFDEYTHYLQPYCCDQAGTTGQTYMGYEDIWRMEHLLHRGGFVLTDLFVSPDDYFSLQSQIRPITSATVPYGLRDTVSGSIDLNLGMGGVVGTINNVRVHISNKLQYLKTSDDVSTTDGNVREASRVGKDWEWLLPGNEALWDNNDTTTGGVSAKHHRCAVGMDLRPKYAPHLNIWRDLTAEEPYRKDNQSLWNYQYWRGVPSLEWGKGLVILYGLDDVRET